MQIGSGHAALAQRVSDPEFNPLRNYEQEMKSSALTAAVSLGLTVVEVLYHYKAFGFHYSHLSYCNDFTPYPNC